MNPKKAKAKERRRARKLAEQAWEAANEQNLDLAEKIIRRAVTIQPENPALWNDQGLIQPAWATHCSSAFETDWSASVELTACSRSSMA